jgi:hypothetical protein
MVMAVIVLVVLGFCLYLLETYVPMSPPMVMLIRAVVILFSVLWILSVLGVVNIPLKGL